MTFDDITFTYTLDKVLKNKTTGLITEVRFTYSGTAGGQTVSIPNNKQWLAPSDPSSADFINIDAVTQDNIINWIDTSISEVVNFDIEELRGKDTLPWLDEDDPKQPKNQDLSNFRHSSRKEQMQESIRLSLEQKIADSSNENEFIEHTF